MADPVLEAWLKQGRDPGQKQPAEDNLSSYRNPLLTGGVRCADCHPKKEENGFRLSLTGFDGNNGFSRLKRGNADLDGLTFKPLTPEQKAAAEKREAEKFQKEDPIEKTLHVLSRMPANMSIQFTDKKLSFRTDMARMLESVPGVTLDDTGRKLLSSIKELSLEGKTFSLDFNQKQTIPVNRDIPLLGTVKELSIGNEKNRVTFDVDFDKNSERVALKNIQGISLQIEGGKSIGVRELSLDSSCQHPLLHVTIDNPKDRPSYISESLWPKTISVPVPLEKIVPGMNADFVKGMVKTLSDAKAALQNKDGSMFLSGITDEGIRGKLEGMLKGVTSITKNGDTFEIKRNNGETKHDFGGPELTVSPTVRFKVGTDIDSPSIRNIEGINFSAPLPSELGLGDKFNIGLKEINLGPKYDSGRRLSVHTDSLLDSVTINLDQNMKPITDNNGNWSAGISIKNPLGSTGQERLNFNLRLDSNGKPNMTTSEILNLTSRATAQGVDFSLAGGGLLLASEATGAAADVASVVEWISSWFD